MASVPEVLAVAAYVREKFTDDDRARLMEAIDRVIAATEGMTYVQRHDVRVACPLLKDGACMAYEIRPAACRWWHSFDVDSCRNDFESPASHSPITANMLAILSGHAIHDGHLIALKAERLEHRDLEFVRGLKIALDDPSLISTWRSRPRAFDGALFRTVYPSRSSESDRADKIFTAHYREITNNPAWKAD
jgi:hypothetical protein